MAQPTLRDVHVDEVLSEISIRYRNETYIADEIFPLVTVGKQSNKIRKYTKSYWFRDEARIRAPGEQVHESGYEIDNSTTYYAENYAIGKPIPDELRANADEGIDLEREATEWVTDKLQLKRERSWASDFFTTGVWGTDLTVSPQWDSFSDSTPIVDIRTGKETIHDNTGIEPNTLVLGRAVFNSLIDHPAFTERIKYTETGIVTTDLLSRILELDRVLVARAVYETAAEGETSSMSAAFGKNALLMYVEPAPSILRPSAGYTLVWKPLGGAGPQVIQMRRNEERYSDVIDGLTWYDQKALGTDLGYFFSNAVA